MFMFVNADLNQKSNIFIRAGTKTWIWTFINNSYHVTVFESRGSLGSYYMYLQLDHVIRVYYSLNSPSLFWNCSRTAWIVKIVKIVVKLPGVWQYHFFLESNIFLIKMRIFFFSCNSHGWTVFDFFFRLKENLRGRCGWCWTEKEKTKTDQN